MNFDAPQNSECSEVSREDVKDDMEGIVPGENLGLDQSVGFNLCKEGHNMFITGVAGTGKILAAKAHYQVFEKCWEKS